MEGVAKPRRVFASAIFVTAVVAAILATVAVPQYRRQCARRRLKEIIGNLGEIDLASEQCCMEASYSRGVSIDRRWLDGTGGTEPYLARPKGPVPGDYVPGICSGSPATFDGGSKGSMNSKQWQKTCSADPVSCGL